jgi:hypothetical protein
MSMAVLAIFTYDVTPGRMGDFLAKLKRAGSPEFNSPVMPSGFRMFRSTVPGPDTGSVMLFIEYPDMAAYGARTAWEQSNPKWRELFAACPDSPERLVSVQLLTEFVPG